MNYGSGLPGYQDPASSYLPQSYQTSSYCIPAVINKMCFVIRATWHKSWTEVLLYVFMVLTSSQFDFTRWLHHHSTRRSNSASITVCCLERQFLYFCFFCFVQSFFERVLNPHNKLQVSGLLTEQQTGIHSLFLSFIHWNKEGLCWQKVCFGYDSDIIKNL